MAGVNAPFFPHSFAPLGGGSGGWGWWWWVEGVGVVVVLRATMPPAPEEVGEGAGMPGAWVCRLGREGERRSAQNGRRGQGQGPRHMDKEQLRPYTLESTGSRPISEVKLVMASSVLR